jgi:hypothetical protein
VLIGVGLMPICIGLDCHQWYDVSQVSGTELEVIKVPVDVNIAILSSEKHFLLRKCYA